MNDKISLKAKAGFVLVIMALALTAVSCNTYRKINYLQDIVPDKAERIAINKGILIQPKDMISIVVSSRNPELALIFNLPVISYQAGSEVVSGQGSQRLLGYVVDNDGYIDFPVLGLVKAAGLTRWELANEIKSMIIEGNYINDPVVTVEFMNFKISVMGEVTSPGTYNIEGDKITLLQALSLAKDLTIFGRRDNVSVIREQGDERIIYQVDLRSASIFESPAYYLQQNDIVYVEPNKVRAGLMDKRALPMVDEVAKGGLYPRMSVVLNGVAQKEGRYGYGRYGYGYGDKYEYR